MILHVNMFSFETRTLESAFQCMMDMSPNDGPAPRNLPGHFFFLVGSFREDFFQGVRKKQEF